METYGGTKGKKMLTSRKWRRAERWMFACISTRQTAVHVMFGVLRNIHRPDDLVVTETAARWCLSWSHEGSLQKFLRKAIPMAKHWTNSMMRELFSFSTSNFPSTTSPSSTYFSSFPHFLLYKSLPLFCHFYVHLFYIYNALLSPLIFTVISSGLTFKNRAFYI